MTLSLETVRNIQTLRKKGFSYKEIARRFEISPATSYKYSFHIELPQQAKNRLNLMVKRTQLNFKRRYCRLKKIKINHKRLTVEKTRILSHCLWDGHVSKWTVSYGNISESLIEEFKKDMLKVYGVLPDKEYKLTRYARQDIYVINYYSKIICEDLLRYSPSFSTSSPKAIIPDQVLNCTDKKIVKEFLRVLWEDEGSISHDGLIRVKIKGKSIRDQLIRLHKRFAIELTPYREKGDNYGIYIRNNLKNLQKFDEICFRLSSVTNGENKGKLKYDVFSSLIDKNLNPI